MYISRKKKIQIKLFKIILLIMLLPIIIKTVDNTVHDAKKNVSTELNKIKAIISDKDVSIDVPPKYEDKSYITVNDNKPNFTKDDLITRSYELYSDLDKLGRVGTAKACIGYDLMPKEERESISNVYPSGWKQAKYNNIDGGYLYNRCHLIGFQLTGENANEKNLMTGTRYFNVDGMLPFEDMVADYVRETKNHVMYRVTPIYNGNNLVASGVQMEAKSVEDNGEGVCFNVYVYNTQPGIEINYADGSSKLEK